MDLYPRENIVYLTPHCDTELKDYDSDNVYIIGGIVDKSLREPLTLAKAKRDKVKMAKLPLDRHLNMKGAKSLTLNSMVSILLDWRIEKDWKSVLERYVPRRKIKTIEQLEEEERFRTTKYVLDFFFLFLF